MGKFKDRIIQLEEQISEMLHDRAADLDYDLQDIVHEHKENWKEDTRDYIEALLMDDDLDLSLDDLDELFQEDLETMMDDAIDYAVRIY